MVPNGWFGGSPNSLSHVMVQDYIAKYGGSASDINGDVAESYSAGQAIAAAVRATGGTDQSKLIAWLHNDKTTVQTVLGAAHFNAVGENVDAANNAVIFQWQPGAGGTGAKFVQVLPADAAGSVKIIPTKATLSG
jgi:branched-chain amino acid transport system substrate-binding protein